MKYLSLIILLLTTFSFAVEFPRTVNDLQSYLNNKLNNQVPNIILSTDGIDNKIADMQLQTCKDTRASYRLIVNHINVVNNLLGKDQPIIERRRGLMIAYTDMQYVEISLKDKVLAAGIASAILRPNIDIASNESGQESGKYNIGNELLAAIIEMDDDISIVDSYQMMIDITKNEANSCDAYRIMFADYQRGKKRYKEALFLLDSMKDPNMIKGILKYRQGIAVLSGEVK